MKRISVILAFAVFVSLFQMLSVNVCAFDENPAYTYTPVSSSTAYISSSDGSINSAVISNEDIAEVSLASNIVTVTGKPGVSGIAELNIDGTQMEIPIGYTTFVFSGDALTVYPGSSTNYEVTAINEKDEEIIPEPEQAEDGSLLYENSETHKLNVGLKKKGGTYVFTGIGNDMSIAVKKEAAAPTNILLAGLDLTSSLTAPISVKKDSSTTAAITALKGHINTLTDNYFNNSDIYGDPESDDGNGDNLISESAVIKGKAAADLTLQGGGVININCRSKNAIKVGEYGHLTIKDLTLNIFSPKNGISSDNTLTIDSGTINIQTLTGDAIRSDPDAVDPESGCSGNIVINGGSITAQSGSDCIQAAQDLTITGGVFSLVAGAGYNDTSFDKDESSCKALKASSNSDETDILSDTTNLISISGGEFLINSADDAIHSDADVNITGGSFFIQTGDDGVHADAALTLGTNGSTDNAEPNIYIDTCYEGLEGGCVYIYSGFYHVISSDDGINAAGGNDGSGGNPGDHFRPGKPGGDIFGKDQVDLKYTDTPLYANGFMPDASGSYCIDVYGGNIYMNTNGDGFDSNGSLSLNGGNIIVWGQEANRDNNPLDCEGTFCINGATVFAAGSQKMSPHSISGGQKYVTSTNNYYAGQTVTVTKNSNTLLAIKAVKNIDYYLYSSPDMTSHRDSCFAGHAFESTFVSSASCDHNGLITYTCAQCGELLNVESAPAGHAWNSHTLIGASCTGGTIVYSCSVCNEQHSVDTAKGHSWNGGVITSSADCVNDGLIDYTCTVCSAVKSNILPALGHDFGGDGCCSRCDETCPRASFNAEHCSINIFYTQSYTAADETNVSQAFARDSDTGDMLSSGDGQINFSVIPDKGYSIVSVSADKNYKNLKDQGNNIYRLTKVTGDLTVTVAVKRTDPFTYSLNGSTATVYLDYSEVDGVANGSYTVVAAFYDENGMFTSAGVQEITLDENMCAELSVSCVSPFTHCSVFLLNSDSLSPICSTVSVPEES